MRDNDVSHRGSGDQLISQRFVIGQLAIGIFEKGGVERLFPDNAGLLTPVGEGDGGFNGLVYTQHAGHRIVLNRSNIQVCQGHRTHGACQ